jgi:gamma-glutamyltranspeptidase/glutathione hydrolase
MKSLYCIVRVLTCLAALHLAACGGLPSGAPSERSATYGTAAIAMPDSYSAEVASQILADGGNAIDAGVAAAFTLAVTYPEAGNIGGGGFMLIWFEGQPHFLDYRETAPAAATRDMYLDDGGAVVEGASLVGHLASGVPGTVAGMWEAHARFGQLEWKDLLDPAVELAERGFRVHPQLQEELEAERGGFEGRTNFPEYFGGLRAGAVFRQPELAATLRRIQAQGASGFYSGETAQRLVDEMRRGGGAISTQDLQTYRPVWRLPLRRPWRQYEVLAAPPPSSGGIAVMQLLTMKDRLAPLFAGVAHNSPAYVHLTAEMSKRVFADRAEYLGDPDFHQVPVEQLLDPAYLETRAASVDPERISALATVPPGLEPVHTTHYSIVDRRGNAVANTYTLNTSFGSGVVVEGAGFLLNNEMDDFSIKPGLPNYYGVVGAAANEIAPGKRMLSSMSPTILLEGGQVKMVLGTPGGSTIISSVYQTIVNVLDFGMTPDASVAATRFHHQLLPPDLITFSPSRPLSASTIGALAARGYRVQPHEWDFGDVQLVLRTASGWQAASDPRRRGEARVLN